MKRILQYFRKLARTQEGVAVVEFALCLPFLATLMLGSVEVSRYIIIHQKLEKVAFTVSDVVAQSTEVTTGGLDQLLAATQDIMNPYTFNSDGIVYITSITQTAGSAPTVSWRYSGGGTLSGYSSQLGTIGYAATMPNGLTLNDGDNVIVAEVYYRYEPLLGTQIYGSETLYKTAVYKPRLGALSDPPA